MAESLNGRGADVLQLFFLLQPAVQPTDGRNLGKRLLSLRFRVRIQDSRLVPFYYFPRFFRMPQYGNALIVPYRTKTQRFAVFLF